MASCCWIESKARAREGAFQEERRLPTTREPWNPPDLYSLSGPVGFDELAQIDIYSFGLVSLHVILPQEVLEELGLYFLRPFTKLGTDRREFIRQAKLLKRRDTPSEDSLVVTICELSADLKSIRVSIVLKTLHPSPGNRSMPWEQFFPVVERYSSKT